MPLIDDLVRRAEQELKDLRQELETMDIAISDMQARKAKKQDEEKAARKLYKSLRNQQPTRSRVEQIVKEDKPVLDQLAQNGNTSETEYETAFELLKDRGEPFRLSEFSEITGIHPGAARQKLQDEVTRGDRVLRVEAGKPGQKDSALYKVVK